MQMGFYILYIYIITLLSIMSFYIIFNFIYNPRKYRDH
jgi:hypothetical protein